MQTFSILRYIDDIKNFDFDVATKVFFTSLKYLTLTPVSIQNFPYPNSTVIKV